MAARQSDTVSATFPPRLRTDRHGLNDSYVLSAKHGLVPMDRRLEPYDLSLEDLSPAERAAWALRVKERVDVYQTVRLEVTVLAEELYAEPLRPLLKDALYPLAGMTEDEQKRFLAA